MTATTRYLTILILGVLACGAAAAQTTDGETPATESVCDVLLEPGVTPGLYGLCVAYCEAHDSVDLSLAELMCRPSDDKILDNYNRKKAATDPAMPCVQPDCPCWTLEDALLIVQADPCKHQCYEKVKFDHDGQVIGLTECYLQHKRSIAIVQKSDIGMICEYLGPDGKGRSFKGLTLDQALACREVLHVAAGDECFAP